MARRFLLNGLILAALALFFYIAAFTVLYIVPYSDAPLIYSVTDVLKFKGGRSWQTFQEYDPAKRYDVVVIGSSHAYRGYDPRVFARRGVSMFDLGTSAQSPMNSYHILRHYLNKDNTGLVLLDLYELVVEEDGLESTADLTQNINSHEVAAEMAFALRDPRGVNMLTLRGFAWPDPPRYLDSTYVGSGYSSNPDSVGPKDIEYVYRPLRMVERQQHYLRRFLEHCVEQGIPVACASHPAPSGSDAKRHAEFITWVRTVADPLGIPVFDLAFGHGLPLDDRDHFYDHNHLNQAGVEIFNARLLDLLEREGHLSVTGAR